jgi:outer membrane autotransporter protein
MAIRNTRGISRGKGRVQTKRFLPLPPKDKTALLTRTALADGALVALGAALAKRRRPWLSAGSAVAAGIIGGVAMFPASGAMAACDPTSNVWVCQNTTPGTPETAAAAQATITPTDTFDVHIGTGTDPDAQDVYTNTSDISNNLLDTPGAALIIINDQHSGTVSMTAGSTLTSTKNDGIRFYNTGSEGGGVVNFDIQGQIFAGSLGYQGEPPVKWWGDGIHVGHPGITNVTTPNVESVIDTFTVTVGSESNDAATVQGGDDGIYIGQQITTQATVTNYGTIIGHGGHRNPLNYGVGVNISNINMNLDNGSGPGFQIDGAATVNNYGVIEGHANSGIALTSTPGYGVNIAANGAINVVNGDDGDNADSSISGTTVIYAYGGGSNDITITNYGHIDGTTGSAIQVANGDTAFIGNHSLLSVIGSGDAGGVDAQYFDQVIFDNSGGLTASLTDDAAYIAHVSGVGHEAEDAVSVDNREGVIAGYQSGLVITDVFGSTAEGDANAVVVNNNGFYVDSDWHPGGLIVGVNGNGVDISDVVASEGGGSGSVLIDNRRSGQTLVGLGDLDPLVYIGNSEDGSGLLGDFGGPGANPIVQGGIYGYVDGLRAGNIGGGLTVANESGVIVGMTGVGIHLTQIGGAIDIANGPADEASEGGSIYGYTAGILTSESGSVTIDNRGGTIASDANGGFGVSLSNVTGSVEIDNARGTIFPAGDATTGVYANHVTGGLTIDNGSWSVDPGDSASYGVIIGADGIHLSDVDGLKDIDNSRGIVFGHGSAIIIGDGSSGNVEINNSAGVIEGYLHSAIDITGDGGNAVSIANGHDHGGLILGGKDGSGVSVTSVLSATIDNGVSWWSSDSESAQGGLITGAGTVDHPVIYLNTASESGGGASVYNAGIIAALGRDGYFHTPSDNAGSEGYDPHLPGITLPIDLGQTPGDLQAIYDETKAFANYTASGGALGSLEGFSDYSRAASDLAIVGRNGAVYVENHGFNEDGYGGIVFGRVDLTGSTAAEGDDTGNVFRNYGIWVTVGQNTLTGAGVNAVHNDGVILAATDSATHESTSFDVADFYNDAPLGLGYLSMVDGDVGDTTVLTHDFHGSSGIGEGDSYLAVDAYLDVASTDGGEGGADTLHIDGAATGTTGIIVNVLPASPGGQNLEGIPVVYVGSGTPQGCISGSANLCVAGDTFFISDQSQNYVEINGIGAIQHGLYAWGLSASESGSGSEYDLVSDWAPAAQQAPELLTSGTNIFYDMSDLVVDHLSGGYFEGDGGAGGGGADPVDASKTNAAVWGRVSGSWSKRQATVESTTYGDISSGFNQDTVTLLGGVDMSPGGDGGNVRVGVYGGYTSSRAAFDSYAASAKYTGAVVGGYAAIMNGNSYIDGQVDAQFLDTAFRAPLGGGADPSAKAVTVGFLANTGYRLYAGKSFIEPVVSVSYSNTTLGDMISGPATITFNDTQSLRAGAGARIGTTVSAGEGMSVEYTLLAKVWDEFAGKSSVTISDGTNTDTYSDDTSGIFGEFSGTATTYTADHLLSAYVSGGAQVKSDSTTWNAKVGVRKAF